MKVRVKHNLIFDGRIYKTGEVLEIEAVGYSFTWLTKYRNSGWVEPIDEAAKTEATEPNDGLVAAEGLPSLDEETSQPKGKRNGR